jgi:beta-xylosidase
MNGFNFQQLKNLDKSNFFASNLLNKIRLFLADAIDRVEVAGSSPVGIILETP